MQSSPAAKWCLAAVSLIAGLYGCAQPSAQPKTSSPESLLATIVSSEKNAAVTAELMDANDRSFRVEILRKNLQDGSEAYQTIMEHPEVTEQQRSEARQAYVRLLYLGAKRSEPEYEEKLAAMIKEISEQHPETKEHQIARFVDLQWKYVDHGQPWAETHAALVEYAKQYPDSPEAVTLFVKTAQNLMASQDLRGASHCCKTAESLLGQQPAVQALRLRLQKSMTRDAKRRARDRESSAQYRQVVAQLGGREEGHFIMYSEQKGKGFQVPCDYAVVTGARAAANYIAAAESKNWRWEVAGAYPNSADGLRQAMKEREELVRRNTVTVFGGFEPANP